MQRPVRSCNSVPDAAHSAVTDAQQHLIEAIAAVTESARVDLDAALGRVLASPANAAVSVPGNDNSAMDGYALAATDLATSGGHLPVSAHIHAGDSPATLTPGTAARIFTGAAVPDGADAVVMQEQCRADDEGVRIECEVRHGQNIRRAGEDFAAGDRLLDAGCRLLPQHLGLLAAAGINRVAVFRRPRVTVVSTGNELVRPGDPRGPGQVFDSNNTMLRGLLAKLGCDLLPSRQTPDSLTATLALFKEVREQSDLVITTGGVSVGDADHVRAAIEKSGELRFWRVGIKPGKPLAFGHTDGTAVIGLPGNPVAVFVTFCMLAAPAIRRLAGRTDCLPAPVLLQAGFDREPGRFEEYLRTRIESGCLQTHPRQGSGILSSIVQSSGLARVPAQSQIARGAVLEFHSYDSLLA